MSEAARRRWRRCYGAREAGVQNQSTQLQVLNVELKIDGRLPLYRLPKGRFFSTTPLKVYNDVVRSQFTVKAAGENAVIGYELNEHTKEIKLTHTEIPPIFLGKGVANLLAKWAKKPPVRRTNRPENEKARSLLPTSRLLGSDRPVCTTYLIRPNA
ncbi:unnamed protein product [Chrysodeixis includens]|uniref:Uncharacterized protein n=1 Tax=Chrysodeixis includens TaxID=689277 RepID=A0A9N8KV73_CHRIL|nr:unnamed protein product [Chrysodeixis includens]